MVGRMVRSCCREISRLRGRGAEEERVVRVEEQTDRGADGYPAAIVDHRFTAEVGMAAQCITLKLNLVSFFCMQKLS
jgi:hypothetical protein